MNYPKKEYKPIELKPGNGMLFANKDAKGEMSPQFMGELEIPRDMTGRVKISLWKKTSKAGNTYLSVSLWTPKVSHTKPAGKTVIENLDDGPFEDDPF